MSVIQAIGLFANNPVSQIVPGQVLLHMDSEPFMDERGHTITITGTPRATSNHAKFSNCAEFKLEDSLSFSGSDLVLGTDFFTIDFWVYFSSLATGTRTSIFSYPNPSGTFRIDIGRSSATGNPHFIRVNYNNVDITIYTTNTDFAYNTLHHLAFVRYASDTFTVWLNGINISASTFSANLTGDTFYISNNQSPLLYFDEFRLTKGSALYINTFIPPSAPYS